MVGATPDCTRTQTIACSTDWPRPVPLWRTDVLYLAREECARCGKPWLHPEWPLPHSYPVAYIKPHADDLAEVWCDNCLRQASSRTWDLLKADRGGCRSSRGIVLKPSQQLHRGRFVLCALNGHRERDDGVDAVAGLGFVDAPAAWGVAGDSGVDVGVELLVVGMAEPAFDDRGVKPLRRGAHPCVGLQELDDEEAALLEFQRRRLEPPRVEDDLGDGVVAGELAGIQIRDFDAQRGVLRVYGKGQKERLMPLRGPILAELRLLLSTDLPHVARPPQGDDYLLYPIKTLAAGKGSEGHLLRRSVAAPNTRPSAQAVRRWWYRQAQNAGLVGPGVIDAASHALGHADLTTTLGIYGHFDDSDLEGAMEAYARWIEEQNVPTEDGE